MLVPYGTKSKCIVRKIMEEKIRELIKSKVYQEQTLKFLSVLGNEYIHYSITYLTKEYFKSRDLTTKYIKLLVDNGIIEVSKGAISSSNGKIKRQSNSYRLSSRNTSKVEIMQHYDIYNNNILDSTDVKPLTISDNHKQSIGKELNKQLEDETLSMEDVVMSNIEYIKEVDIVSTITTFDKQLFLEDIKQFKKFWSVDDKSIFNYDNEFIVKDMGRMGSFPKYNYMLNKYRKQLKKKN